MANLSEIFTTKNAKPIWVKLEDSIVPIANNAEIAKVNIFVSQIIKQISENSYMPAVGHGYLGYPKSNGVTRFVPILSKEDMVVYYLIILSIQDYLVNDLPGVYGGWRSVPAKAKKVEDEENSDEIIDPYFSSTFSKKAWFKNWNSFNELIAETCNDASGGNFVIVSDIANFYDTIDNTRLITRIRSDVKGEAEIVSLLGHFLNFWDRRLNGYTASTKGIPQEIITDASRILANYYLNPFDRSFIEYCEKNNLVFIRWADDIVVFGKSPKVLEYAMHFASRQLLKIGLNLSAAKTKHFTKNEFRKFRAIDLLAAARNKSAIKYIAELKKFEAYSKNNEVRLDTAIKTTINFVHKNKAAATNYTKNFLETQLSHYSHLSSLTDIQLKKKHEIIGDIKSNIRKDINKIIAKPYAAPRATYIKFLNKYSKFLQSEGIEKDQIINFIELIAKNSDESEIVSDICAPAAISAI